MKVEQVTGKITKVPIDEIEVESTLDGYVIADALRDDATDAGIRTCRSLNLDTEECADWLGSVLEDPRGKLPSLAERDIAIPLADWDKIENAIAASLGIEADAKRTEASANRADPPDVELLDAARELYEKAAHSRAEAQRPIIRAIVDKFKDAPETCDRNFLVRELAWEEQREIIRGLADPMMREDFDSHIDYRDRIYKAALVGWEGLDFPFDPGIVFKLKPYATISMKVVLASGADLTAAKKKLKAEEDSAKNLPASSSPTPPSESSPEKSAENAESGPSV